MKKIIAIIAAVVALGAAALMSSACQPYEHGVISYHIDEGDFFDNQDILAYAIDKGFEDAGFTYVSTHYWSLTGEKNACNKKAEQTFINRCKAIDKDHSLMRLPLALKGTTIKLKYHFIEEHELTSYTFVED